MYTRVHIFFLYGSRVKFQNGLRETPRTRKKYWNVAFESFSWWWMYASSSSAQSSNTCHVFIIKKNFLSHYFQVYRSINKRIALQWISKKKKNIFFGEEIARCFYNIFNSFYNNMWHIHARAVYIEINAFRKS